MTPRERWLAALHLQPVDRLPFWPKLDGSYPPAQAAPWCQRSIDQLHEWIGSDPHVWLSGCLREVRRRTSAQISAADGLQRTVYHTPFGDCELVCRFDAASQSWHPMSFPVRTLDDVRRMTAFFEDVTIELDLGWLGRAREQAARVGETACTADGIGESPLMHWVEWLAGIEQAHLLLADHPGEVEALFAAMHTVLRRRTELLCAHSPADVLYLVENTSTTLVSPDQYRRYCARHIADYAMVSQAAERNLVLHMCGHLKALLPDLAQLPARAFEAFTTPTVGNATLLEGRRACPDKCLIGGTNAALWNHSAEPIIARLQHDLDALPHHRGLVITSGGVMPPRCPPETIRQVGDWLRAYPLRLTAAA